MIHQYGAHIFHTSNDEVWKYINRFARFNHFINSPLAYSKGKIYNLPFNMNTFNRLWGVITPDEAREKIAEQCAEYRFERPSNLEEQALQLCGKDIYHLFIKEYTEKQWGRKAHLLPASIIKRIPLRLTYDNNYFDDVYQGIPIGGYHGLVQNLLKEIQDNIYQKALNYRKEHTTKVDSYEEFKEKIEEGGFILAHWDGTPETEEKIKEDTKATIRCIPLEADEESLQPGVCMVTGKPSARRVLFARAY